MTQPQTLHLEQNELWARAEELEQPIEGQPSENPLPPCAFAFVVDATTRLVNSASDMRTYLDWGQRERGRLATSLRNAALAYEILDDDAAHAVNAGSSSVSPASPGGLVDDVPEPPTLTDTPMAAGTDLDVTSLKQAAWEIEQSDQGASLARFADEWTAYQRALLDATSRFNRFRPFRYWSGPAAEAIEAVFDRHRSWLINMAELCGNLAEQAQGIAKAHRWAVPAPGAIRDHSAHPSYGSVERLQQEWKTYFFDVFRRKILRDTYDGWVKRSEEVRAGYAERVNTSLESPVRPQMPPTAYVIDPPADPEPDPDPGPGLNPDDELGLDKLLPNPTGMPSVPSLPFGDETAMPDDAVLTDALADMPGLSAGGLKPASFGGGGVPSMPLQPPVDAEMASRPAPPARPVGLPTAARGATGGGGMGMAPMGAPGGQGQGPTKGKRAKQEDKSLYTEERPWTEPVVGRRRRKDALDLDTPGT